MPRDVRRPTNYLAPINLYVEDSLTAAYLATLWDDPAIAFFSGRGNEGVQAIVRSDEEAGHPNVYGLIDRDYGRSNRDQWLIPGRKFRVFVLPVHEIENYLLDADALKSVPYHDRDLTREQIEELRKAAATKLCWWAACREAVAELKRRFRAGFIKDPNQEVRDEAAARAHICDSEWFVKLASEASRSAEGDIHRLLADEHARATACLNDGTWRREFAGKEILKDVGGRICKMPPPADAVYLEDLAKLIADEQVGNVPPDLTDLLAALKMRLDELKASRGLPPRGGS